MKIPIKKERIFLGIKSYILKLVNNRTLELKNDKINSLLKKAKDLNGKDLAEVYLELSDPILHTKKKNAIKYANLTIKIADKINNKHIKVKALTNKLRVYYYLEQKETGLNTIKKINSLLPYIEKESFLIFYTNIIISAFYNQLGLYLRAITSLNQISEYHKSNLKEEHLPNIYNNYAVAFQKMGDNENAFLNFNKALQIYEKYKIERGIAQVCYNISVLYFSNNKENKKALTYIKKSIKIYKKLNLSYNIYSCLSILFDIAILEKKYNEAETYIYESKKIYKSISKSFIKDINLKEGILYYEMKNYKGALTALINVSQSKQNFNNDVDIVIAQSYLARTYIKLNQKKLAIKAFQLAENSLNKLDNPIEAVNLYNNIYEFYKESKNYEQALHYLEKKNEVKNQYLSEEKRKSIALMQVKFETAQKEKEAEQFKNESLKFQLQSLRAQMNPHFVFNAISSIGDDIKTDNVEHSKELLKSFARLMRANLEFAEMEKICLEDEIIFLQDYLILEQNRLKDKLHFEIDYDKNLDVDFIEIPSMLIQPYVENAIKHGIMPLKGKGIINIKFEEKDDYLYCTISDNGIGRKQAEINKKNKEKHLGKSTQITAARLNLMKSSSEDKLKILYKDLVDKSNKPLGTQVTLTIKIHF